jgi:exopolysaccharide biosynthesis polyprenyl glycosylphosphotransferase
VGWVSERTVASLIRFPRASVAGQSLSLVAEWKRRYLFRLGLADAAAAAIGTAVAFAILGGQAMVGDRLVEYGLGVLVAPVPWCLTMAFCRAYEPRFLGVGSEEFRRVLVAATAVVAGTALVSWTFGAYSTRPFLVLALPIATLLTLAQRSLMRHHVYRLRSAGELVQRLVVVGHPSAAATFIRAVSRSSYHGLKVVAACTPGGEDDPGLGALSVPVWGTFDDIVSTVEALEAESVVVLPCPELDGTDIRRLGYLLEQTNSDLMVAPQLSEMVGPRLAVRSVCGVPLLHVDRPELTGTRRLAKAVFDRTASVLALLLLSPLLLLLCLLVRLDSPGPMLFAQTRIGKDGKPFRMYKVRSMRVDAESERPTLWPLSNGNSVLFKMHRDPRVTRVGRWLRRFSLDEIPQLLNVAIGQMSLVGPRPPLAEEAALYESNVRRRLLVKPGITGLWQIKGRSDLDWDESVRLDLRYVENWSFAFDLLILWKTISAVVSGRGAW